MRKLILIPLIAVVSYLGLMGYGSYYASTHQSHSQPVQTQETPEPVQAIQEAPKPAQTAPVIVAPTVPIDTGSEFMPDSSLPTYTAPTYNYSQPTPTVTWPAQDNCHVVWGC